MGAIWSAVWLRPRRLFIHEPANRQASRNSPYKYPPSEGKRIQYVLFLVPVGNNVLMTHKGNAMV